MPMRRLQPWSFVPAQSDNLAPFSSPSLAAHLLDRRFDPSPTHLAGGSAERNAVEDFGDDLRSLADCHSRTIEEQISVGKRHIAFSYSLQVLPPRIALQHTLFEQTSLQIKSARRHNQIFRIGMAELLGRNGGRILSLFSEQELAVRDFH